MNNSEKTNLAIQTLQELVPSEGFYLAFSGGKDSCVCKRLLEMSGVKFDSHYSNTTIDHPPLIKFIREFHSDVKFENPEQPLLKRMVYKGFPLRQSRWCCKEYKENGGDGRFVITGLRASESSRRSKRKQIEFCYSGTGKRYLNIIFDWEFNDVWNFIHQEKIPYCKLYDEGFERLGCVFCPESKLKHRQREMAMYPAMTRAFKRAFCELYNDRKSKGLGSVDRWKDGNDMFNFWINEDQYVTLDQLVIFE